MTDSLYDRIDKIIQRMNKSDSEGMICYIALALQDKDIHKLVDKFLTMDKNDIGSKMLDNIGAIIAHSKTVYESDKYRDPFSDEIYDKMLSRYNKYRPEPFGSNSTGLANAHYKYDVLSGTLDKTHFIRNSDKPDNDSRDSMEDYMDSIPAKKSDVLPVLVNQKKDGTSVTIDYKYKNGSYYANSAISRGKKDYGEGTDVSAVMPECEFSGKQIKKLLGYCPKYIGVQYEMLISNEAMFAFEEYLGQKFANNRSAVAGLLRRMIFAKKSERAKMRNFESLVPVGFDILPENIEDKKSYYKIPWNVLYEVICDTFIYGDISMEYDVLHGTKSEILDQFEEIANKQLKNRKKLNHAIDGMVMTILDRDIQTKMGRVNNKNKFQIAYKFPESGIKTKVLGYTITTGNFGYKEILLNVEPVVLNGTIQGKAQLHSLNRFKKMDLRIGDEIILKLSGDVIPYGYKDGSCHEGSGKRIKLPTVCECGAPLVEEKNKLRCTNKRCPYRVIGSMITFFTELNAKGIGPQTCKQVYEELGISKPSDILKLKETDFAKLDGFKDKSAKMCINTITDILKKPRTIPAILSALGIDSFRTSTANKLLEKIDFAELIELVESGDKPALIKAIRESDGINETAGTIAEGLINNIDEIKELISMMTIKNENKVSYDKSILISGMRNDDELTAVANASGYDVRDSGKKYDILVVKDESYLDKSKAQYARSKHLPIMTRAEFIKAYKK